MKANSFDSIPKGQGLIRRTATEITKEPQTDLYVLQDAQQYTSTGCNWGRAMIIVSWHFLACWLLTWLPGISNLRNLEQSVTFLFKKIQTRCSFSILPTWVNNLSCCLLEYVAPYLLWLHYAVVLMITVTMTMMMMMTVIASCADR